MRITFWLEWRWSMGPEAAKTKGKNGSTFPVLVSNSIPRDHKGKPTGVIGALRHITELKKTQAELKKTNETLELRVEERTQQLEAAKRQFLREIQKREEIEKELKAKAVNVEELKTALNVLLQRRGEEKTKLEESVMANMMQLVQPYIDRMKHTKLSVNQVTLLTVIEKSLKGVTSSFSRKLGSTYLTLTPTELQVADLIRQGKDTKDIADLMNLSWATIKGHRRNIRTKLKIRNQKTNLRAHLLSLT
jgi:DNA-binding CsgD family transcriptional regulator